MSFSAVATYTTDKSPDMFSQGGFEDLGSDFFDQFITYSPLEDEPLEYPVIPEATYLENISDSHSGDLSLSFTDDEAKQLNQDSWRGDAWANNSAASLTLPGSFYSELSGRAAISDSELLSLENINLDFPVLAQSQTSLPPSPAANAPFVTKRKNRIVESLSKTLKKATASLDKRLLRSPIRKPSASPKMMRLSNKSSLDLLENFDFSIPSDTMPLSPPPSAKALEAFQAEDLMTLVKEKHFDDFTYSNVSATSQLNLTTPYDTPLSIPLLEGPSSRRVSQQTPLDTGLCPVTPQAPNDSSAWSHLPTSPDFATLDTSIYPIPDLDSPLWYGHNTTTQLAQPSPSGFHTNPQRATKSLAMQLQNGLAFNNNDLSLDHMSGLGIQMPSNNQVQGQGQGQGQGQSQASFAMGSPIIMQTQQQQGYFPSPNHQPQQLPPHAQPHRHQSQGHALNQQQMHAQNQNSHVRHLSLNVPMGGPSGAGAAGTRHPSSSSSNRPRHQYSHSVPHLSPLLKHQTIPSHHNMHNNNSGYSNGNVSGNGGNGRLPHRRSPSSSPSPTHTSANLPNFAIRKRKSATNNNHNSHSSSSSYPHPTSASASSSPAKRSSSTPRTSTSSTHRSSSAKTDNSSSLEVSFVNYTPSDSRKILGGVAPSGSSKTKARREKEALEKRRKLSAAAVRAVRAAGGSLEGLEGFIV